MKVALCLHGLFSSAFDAKSNGHDGFNYIKKNILQKVNADIYIHSWELDKEQEIVKLYNPKKYIFEPQKTFVDLIESRNLNNLQNARRPIKNVISHFYSVTESIKLAFESDVEYDIVIKSRFDLGRINRETSGPNKQNPFPVQCINLQTNIQKNKLYMANWNHFKMGPADMWFYGCGEIMNEFTKLFEFLKQELYIDSEYHKFAKLIEGNSGDLSNSIAFYKYWMIKNNLWNKKITLDTEWE